MWLENYKYVSDLILWVYVMIEIVKVINNGIKEVGSFMMLS